MIKIDIDTRCWQIPKEECFLGIESDDKVKILQFELSKNEFCNGLNFTDCNCFINYKNEGNDTIPYLITDMEVQEDGTVTFTWEVSRGATIFKGNTFAVFCAKKVREDGTITNEWNSRIGSFIVAKGLEPSSSITEVPEIDIISQLLSVAQKTNAKAETNINQSSQLLEKAEGLGYLKEEYDVLEARMNQFTSLKDGSTTGDAELQDIRVGTDGKTYDTAGDAVRGQIGELKGDLDELPFDVLEQYIDKTKYIDNKAYNQNSTTTFTVNGYSVYPPIKLKANTTYYYKKIITIFSNVYNGTTATAINAQNYPSDGSITPTEDCEIYITTLSSDKYRAMFSNYEISGDYEFGKKYNFQEERILNLPTKTSQLINDSGFGVVEKKYYYVGVGKEYTRLIDAINDAVKVKNAIVYIYDGVYDLIQELGADYFSTFQRYQKPAGIVLCNGVHLIFSSGAKVKCNYTGSNPAVAIDFSPFNASTDENGAKGGFTIENMNLECSNVRYAIHDERLTCSDSYRNQYINCNIKCDNRNNIFEGWYGANCIGGGLGRYGEIIIKNCIFESLAKIDGDNGVSYHNSGASNSKSRIVFDGNYVKGAYGTFVISHYGTSEDITIAIVSNNSLGKNPVLRKEVPTDETQILNCEMLAFNNNIRGN